MQALVSIMIGLLGPGIKQQIRHKISDGILYIVSGLVAALAIVFAFIALFFYLEMQVGAIAAALYIALGALVIMLLLLMTVQIRKAYRRRLLAAQIAARKAEHTSALATGALVSTVASSPVLMSVIGAGLLAAAYYTSSPGKTGDDA